jgi:hypothetical protein
MIKTVLVPGAPWPENDATVKAKKTPQETDVKFAEWYMKNGTFQHIQQLGRRRHSIFDKDFKK